MTQKTWNFPFTTCKSDELLLEPGTYRLETWGASGGRESSDIPRELGGYSRGVLTLNKQTKHGEL